MYTQNAEELELRAKEAIKSGTRLLVVFGGDGTFQNLVNAAYGADVVMGILPGGGGNDFASALGLPKDPVAAARAILTGSACWVNLARARTPGGRDRIYVGGGGLGIDAEAARHASGSFRVSPGRSRYIASALRALTTHRRLEVRAEFPGSELQPIETTAMVAAVLNTPTYGAGIRLAQDARIDDGLLDFAIVEGMSKFSVLGLLPRLAKSGELRTPRLKHFKIRSVRLAAEPPSLFHGDGEILGPAPVKIEVVPKAIRVIASSHA